MGHSGSCATRSLVGIEPALSPIELSWNLAVLLAVAGVGRVALAFLPAGLPGRHGPGQLADTWAACHLLGLAALHLQLALLVRVSVEPNGWTLFLPWVLLAVVRVESLPAAMVPRHEPRAERPGRAATLVLAATLLAVITAAWRVVSVGHGPSPDAAGFALLRQAVGAYGESPGLLGTASYGALLVLVARGLSTARRAPLDRRLLVLALACTPLLFASAAGAGGSAHAGLFVAAAGAFGLAWLRRADRRAGALALIALLALPLFDPGLRWLALAGGASLVAADSRDGAGRAAARAAAVLVGGGAALFALERRMIGEPFAGLAGRFGSFAIWPLWWLAAVAAAGVALARSLRARPGGSAADRPAIEAPARESLFLGLFLGSGLVAVGLAPPSASGAEAAGLLALLPVAALLAGLVFLRTETPGGAA